MQVSALLPREIALLLQIRQWHVNCSQNFENGRMATKIRIMRMLQEIRGLAEITHRRPHVRQPGLFLIQLRSHVQQTTHVRRKQTIAVEILHAADADTPQPVKITHLPASSHASPPAPAPEIRVLRAVAP